MTSKPLRTATPPRLVSKNPDGDCPAAPLARELAAVFRARSKLVIARPADDQDDDLKALTGLWSESLLNTRFNEYRGALCDLLVYRRATSKIGALAQALIALDCSSFDPENEGIDEQYTPATERRRVEREFQARGLIWSVIKVLAADIENDQDAAWLLQGFGRSTEDHGDPPHVAVRALMTGHYEVTEPLATRKRAATVA